MAICIRVVVASVNCRQACILDVEHASTQDMACVVGSDFDIVDDDGLEEADAGDFGRGRFDFLNSKRIELFLFFGFGHNFAVIFEHDGEQGFCGSGSDDRSAVAMVLSEIW